MKRRKKTAYIEYDYEAAYKRELKKLEEANAERMLKEGKVRSLYATKEIRSGEVLEVEIYPEFTRGKKKDAFVIDAAKKMKQRKAQRNLNDVNSRKECDRTINANFGEQDIWATLTYTDEEVPESMEEAQRDMTNYIRRLNHLRKKRGLKNTRYVYTTECSEKGRWHHHIVLDGDIDMDAVESTWKKGRRNQVRRLHKDENGLTGMSRYITKQKHEPDESGEMPGKYKKAWKASKGLKKPKIDKNHYKFKQKDVDEVVTGHADMEEKLDKWYGEKGYRTIGYVIRYNQMNGRYYIYARMHKDTQEGERDGRKKGKRKKIPENPERKKKADAKKATI